MHETFRLHPHFRIIGFIGVILTPLAALFLGVNFYFDPPKVHPHRLAWSIAGLLSVFLGMSLWVVAACQTTKLVITGDRIEKYGVFGRKEIHLGEVTEARWKSRRPGGDRGIIFGIVLISSVQRLRIELREFHAAPPDRLIRFFRDNLDPKIQSGWEGIELVRKVESAPKVAVHGYMELFLLNLFLAVSPLFFFLERWGTLVVMSTFFVSIWLFGRFTRRASHVARAESKAELTQQTRGILAIWAIASATLLFSNVFISNDLIQSLVTFITLGFWIFGCLFYLIVSGNRLQRRDVEAILARGMASSSLDGFDAAT